MAQQVFIDSPARVIEQKETARTGWMSSRPGKTNAGANQMRSVRFQGLPAFPKTVPPPQLFLVAVASAPPAALLPPDRFFLQAVNRSNVI